MDVLSGLPVFLLTVFLGWLLFQLAFFPLVRQRIWHALLGLTTGTGGVLEDQQIGLARVHLPHGWRPVATTQIGSLHATDPFRGRYLLVWSESRADFTDAVDLHEYARLGLMGFIGSRSILERHGPDELTVGDYRALRTEVVIADARFVLHALHTAIEGHRAFHQVIIWSLPSRFDRNGFVKIVDGFAEVPGPVTMPRSSVAPAITPPSDYEVH